MSLFRRLELFYCITAILRRALFENGQIVKNRAPACRLDLPAVAGSGGSMAQVIGKAQADGQHLCRLLHRVDTSLRLRLCRVRVRRLDSICFG